VDIETRNNRLVLRVLFVYGSFLSLSLPLIVQSGINYMWEIRYSQTWQCG